MRTRLHRKIVNALALLVFGLPMLVLYALTLLVSKLFRTNNPSITSWSGDNP